MSKTRFSWETVFSADHQPKKIIGRKRRYRTLPGTFPTAKAASGLIRTRLPLMMDGLVHLDTDPDVEAVAEYPLETSYWSQHHATGRFLKRDHVPDLAFRVRGGAITLVDFVPYNIQVEQVDFDLYVAQRRQHYQDEYAVDYIVYDERQIHAQPRFYNVNLMWSHKATRFERYRNPAKELLAAVPRPLSIENLARLMVKAGHSSTEMAETDAFTAAMRMCMDGSATIDMSKRLNMSSEISSVGGCR